MLTGIRGGRDFYKERYGLSDRLAVRLAALLSRKVDLTAAAIECLKDSPPVQHVLLRPDLLDAADRLDTERLRAMALPGEEWPAPLVVAEHKGWRTIALEEELLDDQGPEEGDAGLPVLAERAEVLHPSEIRELFSRRDVAELELTLRTSADAKEKVTALRRLALSPAGDREKMALFATALTDRDAEVRGEAAEAMTTLGLPREVAEEARALAEGSDRQKRSAAQRIGSRILVAADTEMGVLLRIIAGTLRYEPSVGLRRLLIRAIEGACRAIARDAHATADLVRVLLGQLRDDVEELGPEARRVLLILGRATGEGEAPVGAGLVPALPGAATRAAPTGASPSRSAPSLVCRLLQEELAKTPAGPVRRLLVAAAMELARTDAECADACRLAVGELLTSADPAIECLPIVNSLSRVGDSAVAVIAERLLDAPEAAQEELVRLLDSLATRHPAAKATKARIGRLLLDVLRNGHRMARLAVIQATATMDPALPATVRGQLAAELMACLPEYANPGTLAAIEATAGRLGAPAVAPLLDTLRQGGRLCQRLSAARILGELVPMLEERHAKVARQAIEALLGLLAGDEAKTKEVERERVERGERKKGPEGSSSSPSTLHPPLSTPTPPGLAHAGFPDRALLARTLGRMCAGPAADEATVARVAVALRARVVEKGLSNAALDGLGRLCLSPRAAPTLKVELVRFFSRLIERELPEIQPKKVVQASRLQIGRQDACPTDEIVYELGNEVTAYTELVPGLIAGLRNIALSSGGALREEALATLLAAWRAIAEGTLQLGPANTEAILDALRALGTLPRREGEAPAEPSSIDPKHREAIADALALRRDFLPTYRALADLIVAAGDAMAARAAALAEALLRREAGDRTLTESDRVAILLVLVQLATAASLGPGAARLRERIATAVIEADKREARTAHDLLIRLAESPALPDRLRARLAARLPRET